MHYLRGGREREARLSVAALPTVEAQRVSVLGQLELITVTAAVQQERGLQSNEGALIYQIGESAQQATGMRSGDVIIQLDRRRITSAADVRAILERTSGRTAIRAYFERGGRLRISDFTVR